MSAPQPSREAEPALDPLIGRTLAGRYEIVRHLGSGGAGRVYVGVQHPLGREVAIKVLRTDVDAESASQFAARFAREAALASRLRHPNVVTVHDCGTTADGLQYVVMELLVGRSLKTALREGPLANPDLLRIAIGLARGLRHAHAEGLIHRDVKPSNILLVRDDDGREVPKLLDFGLVKEMEEVAGMTLTGSYMGTPAYMSPEQTKGEAVDQRSDLYALGCVLFELATGRRPFQRPTAVSTAIAHLQDPVPTFGEVAPDRQPPAGLEGLVRRLLAKEPDQRPSDAGEVVSALKGLGPRPAMAEPTAPAAPPRERAGARWALGAGLVGGLLLLALAATAAVGLGAWWWARTVREGASPEVASLDQASAPARAAPSSSDDPMASASPAPTAPPSTAPTAPPSPSPTAPPSPAPTAPPSPSPTAPPSTSPIAPPSTSPIAPPSTPPVVSTAPAVATPPPRPTPSAPSPPSAAPSPAAPELLAAAVIVDGVRFTPEHAARALAFANTADEAALRRAGVYGRGVGILLEGRPFASLSALGDTPYVGEKTMEAIARATAAP